MATGPTPDEVMLTTRPSGLRVVTRRCEAAVEHCGVVAGVGSRDDDALAPGMAHFVEHTIFKGTARRTSSRIINRMESVGGELNAYTTKEETVVFTVAPSGNADRSLELVADLITGSQFPEKELEKERDVVCDEIDSYLDSPADAVFDDFEDIIFAGTPLGHNILGTKEAVQSFSPEQCREYLRKFYTAPNLVVFYSGPLAHDKAVAKVEKYFASLPAEPAPARIRAEINHVSFNETRNIGSHQAHTVMGAILPDMHSPERYAYALLSNILGGPGMNSLLNVALREKRGLVYSVEASSAFLSDTGLFTIYFGCDPDDASRCARLVSDTIRRTAGLTDTRLQLAKKQYMGQMTVARDNRESVIISAARNALYYNKVYSFRSAFDRIHSVGTENIVEATENLLNLNRLIFI